MIQDVQINAHLKQAVIHLHPNNSAVRIDDTNLPMFHRTASRIC